MTESQKLEAKLKQIKEHCEEARESIRSTVKSYGDLLDVVQDRSDYMINEITLLSLDREFVTLMIRFEDNQTLFVRVVPKEVSAS